MKRSFFQKKLRSITKRAFVPFINQSSSYIVQHLPEWVNFDFGHFRKIWLYKNKMNNDADLIRLLFLTSIVKELKSVKGAFAELGVYKGNSAKLFHTLDSERELYLFDTFKGFDEKDIDLDPKKKIHSSHFLDTSLEEVSSFINGNEKVHFCPGYFPKTAEMVPEGVTFALVHLDADLYKPILDGLKFFYPKMAVGGAMIIHDYSSGAWPGVKKAADEFLTDKPEKLVPIPDKSGTVIFRKI